MKRNQNKTDLVWKPQSYGAQIQSSRITVQPKCVLYLAQAMGLVHNNDIGLILVVVLFLRLQPILYARMSTAYTVNAFLVLLIDPYSVAHFQLRKSVGVIYIIFWVYTDVNVVYDPKNKTFATLSPVHELNALPPAQ